MFTIQNTRTGKTVKNAISGKPMVFNSFSDADTFAKSLKRDSILEATAWNNKRNSTYSIVAA